MEKRWPQSSSKGGVNAAGVYAGYSVWKVAAPSDPFGTWMTMVVYGPLLVPLQRDVFVGDLVLIGGAKLNEPVRCVAHPMCSV